MALGALALGTFPCAGTVETPREEGLLSPADPQVHVPHAHPHALTPDWVLCSLTSQTSERQSCVSRPPTKYEAVTKVEHRLPDPPALGFRLFLGPRSSPSSAPAHLRPAALEPGMPLPPLGSIIFYKPQLHGHSSWKLPPGWAPGKGFGFSSALSGPCTVSVTALISTTIITC